MKVGKLSSEELESLVLNKINNKRHDVLVHAGIGEDCSVLDFGDEVCIISTDPITGASEGIGELAVHVSCNDVASNGGHPVGVQVMLLLPENTTNQQIAQIMEEIDKTTYNLGIEVLGGHTEITSKVQDVIISVTAIGRAKKDKYVSAAGAKAGNDVIITKGVGIEGSAIIAREFADKLPAIPSAMIEQALSQLSVIKEGILAAEFGVTAMHDITEGGLLGGAVELATASNVGMEIWEDKVYIPHLTKIICEQFDLNPLALLSSGSMLMTVENGTGLIDHLQANDINAYKVGKVREDDDKVLVKSDKTIDKLPKFINDELWRLYS